MAKERLSIKLVAVAVQMVLVFLLVSRPIFVFTCAQISSTSLSDEY